MVGRWRIRFISLFICLFICLFVFFYVDDIGRSRYVPTRPALEREPARNLSLLFRAIVVIFLIFFFFFAPLYSLFFSFYLGSLFFLRHIGSAEWIENARGHSSRLFFF